VELCRGFLFEGRCPVPLTAILRFWLHAAHFLEAGDETSA
jgi:hypothetical protein